MQKIERDADGVIEKYAFSFGFSTSLKSWYQKSQYFCRRMQNGAGHRWRYCKVCIFHRFFNDFEIMISQISIFRYFDRRMQKMKRDTDGIIEKYSFSRSCSTVLKSWYHKSEYFGRRMQKMELDTARGKPRVWNSRAPMLYISLLETLIPASLLGKNQSQVVSCLSRAQKNHCNQIISEQCTTKNATICITFEPCTKKSTICIIFEPCKKNTTICIIVESFTKKQYNLYLFWAVHKK